MGDEHYIATNFSIGLTEDFLRTLEVARVEPEGLTEPGVIDRLLKSHAVEAADADVDDVMAARILREDIRKLFERASEIDAVKALSDFLAGADIGVRLQPSEDGRFSLVPVARSHQDPIETLRSLCLIEIADAVSRKGFACLQTCQAAPCQDAFIDRSKKGGRLFCSPRCSSRYHVQRHRERSKV
ncbi:CGNR zinc finger domain-containing protein [Agrobacterium pusense]|uniref:CGNR zinc finger domain-containing protein n=1 Tax=Agrobacterium pusense TaxID=648995 RepID=A0AA44IY34_9HYPH|nr:CGNR zinc finger domain-containing protein [Agrobacterium pusense]NRF18055.1 CGNR zinc finger domain-containing protein [Agrobacterium pusense]PZU78348.1 MAG: hypothetical protein DI546_03555 [Rhizobium sp.]